MVLRYFAIRGSGKTTAIVNIATQSKYTAKKEFGHVIVVAKHPAQSLFQRLLEAIEVVSFVRLKTHTSEEEFLNLLKLAPDKNTAIIFDDVR